MERIIEFDEVSWSGTTPRHSALSRLSMGLGPGDLALIRADEHGEHCPLFELAQGLFLPDGGVVRFQGKSWARASDRQRLRMRGRIGRVFREQAWVSNLSVYENIALSPRFHGTLPEDEIRERVNLLSAVAGIQDVLFLRPNRVHRRALQLAQWVRAFLGHARLVLLHHPARGLRAELHPLLLEWVGSARDEGCALVWITSSASRWQDDKLDNVRRFVFSDGSLAPSGEDD